MISVIIPMHNASKTIEKAINSVLAQDYPDFELIVVDDCSTDNSVQIINLISDERIRLVSVDEVRGPGHARNIGIDCATGEYVLFVDSDDYIDSNMLSILLKYKCNFDTVICGYYQEYTDHTIMVLPCPNDTIALLDEHKIFSFCWNKLYSLDLIKKNRIRFPDLMHSEDFFFNIEYFKYAVDYQIVEEPLYHYVKPHMVTLTTRDYLEGYYELIMLRYAAMCKLCDDNESQPVIANVHLKHLLSVLINNCSKKSEMNFFDRREFIKQIISNQVNLEAIENCKLTNRASIIINPIMKTKSIFVIQIFAYISFIFKNKFQILFDRIK